MSYSQDSWYVFQGRMRVVKDFDVPALDNPYGRILVDCGDFGIDAGNQCHNQD